MQDEKTEKALEAFHEKGELIKEAHLLNGPTISGDVKVNLLELDRMRTDHAQAVKLAKELEARQMQVKVTVVKKTTEKGRDIFDNRWGLIKLGREPDKDRFEQLSVDYLNLEDVRSNIEKEAKDRWQQKIDAANTKQNELQKELYDLKIERRNLGIELTSQRSLYKEIDTRAVNLQLELDQTIEDLKSWVVVLGNRDKEVAELKIQLVEEKKKRSFWFWLMSLFGVA